MAVFLFQSFGVLALRISRAGQEWTEPAFLYHQGTGAVGTHFCGNFLLHYADPSIFIPLIIFGIFALRIA
jgi:hypothetical protein